MIKRAFAILVFSLVSVGFMGGAVAANGRYLYGNRTTVIGHKKFKKNSEKFWKQRNKQISKNWPHTKKSTALKNKHKAYKEAHKSTQKQRPVTSSSNGKSFLRKATKVLVRLLPLL